MYRAFNFIFAEKLKLLSNDIDTGKQLADLNSQEVRSGLEKFIRAGKIDGSALQSHWFPTVEANVFISHASNDQEAAFALAGILKTYFGIESFIDSCVWGYADDLLKQVDDAFCKNAGENSYSYEKRNGTTSHVHMMLSTALAEMMDRAEVVIFLSSPQSVTIVDSIKAVGSPWIYHELMLTKLLRRKSSEDHRGMIKEAKARDFSKRPEQLPFLYTPSFDSLTQTSFDDLLGWLTEWIIWNGNGVALDALYKIKPLDTASDGNNQPPPLHS